MGESHDWHWHAHLCQHETPSCLPSHSHHHNADSTHSGRAKAALGTIPPLGAQVPSCPGAQVLREPSVCGGPRGEREPDKECEMRARPRTLTQLLRTKNMSTRVRTIIKNVLLNINCATSPPSKPIVSREQYTRVF